MSDGCFPCVRSCLYIKEIKKFLQRSGDKLFIPGIIIGIAGIAGVGAAYPLYTRMVKKKRAELAPEIMRLTDELMK